MKIFNGKYMRLFGVAGLIVIADQITKALILKSMPLYQSVSVIPGLFGKSKCEFANHSISFDFITGCRVNLLVL